MYQIYWIKYLNQTNPYSEGYIGISNNVKSRLRYHSSIKSSDNLILFRAIKKGADLVILETVDTKEEALLREINYRPSARIGWNIIPGGISPPSQKGRLYPGKRKDKKHLESTKKLMSEQRKGTKWWTNGDKNIRSHNTPDGFVEGRTVKYKYNLTEAGKKNIGKSGIEISTPYGNFPSIASASKHLNIKSDVISYKLKKEKYNEWNYLRK